MNDCCGGETIQDVMKEMAPRAGLSPYSLQWRRLDRSIEMEIERVFNVWLKTLYVPGQRVAKMGVDCTQLIPGIWDMLFKSPKPSIVPRLRSDSGVHKASAGDKTLLAIRKAFDIEIVEDGIIEPGDAIACKGTFKDNAPERMGHALIAGIRPLSAIHAVRGARVCMTSLAQMTDIVSIWRPRFKERWAA